MGLKTKYGSAVMVSALLLSFLPSAGAFAKDTTNAEPSTEYTYVEAPMTFGGFDEKVAAQNGFKIVTASDGTQTSVPVSAAALAQVQATPSLAAAAAAGEAINLCGKSRVGARKRANNELAVTTGYLVPFPVVRRNWYVNAVGFITSATIRFPDVPTSGSWGGEGGATVIGPGIANVPLTAFVTGANGRTCYSALPTATFG
ncbi:MAG: hypothetical protein LH624_11165 [Cryobacterium sp.]|nr:hypothetical protein [Cryobacterium sp.]